MGYRSEMEAIWQIQNTTCMWSSTEVARTCTEQAALNIKHLGEQIVIEKIRVTLTSSHSKPWQVRKFFDRDCIRHFERKLEVIRRLSHHPVKESVIGKLVEGRINADGLEYLGISPCLIRLSQPRRARFGSQFLQRYCQVSSQRPRRWAAGL